MSTTGDNDLGDRQLICAQTVRYRRRGNSTAERFKDEDRANDAKCKDLQKTYRFEQSQARRLVPMPRPDSTVAWLKKESPRILDRLNNLPAMTFRWRDPDRLSLRTSHFGSIKGWPLR